MAITIDYTTRIISIPKSDMTLVQSTPNEVRELDTNTFRLTLKDIEDDVGGVPFVDTHLHFTEVELGGIVYARLIQIINGYTITFEDGQYIVNLIGSNNNVLDVTNLNQVSVRPSNAAGLISNSAIEFSSFVGGVTIDVLNGSGGTIFPTGTPQQPANNVADAILIADTRGLPRFYIIGDITFGATDNIDGYEIVGEEANRSIVTLTSGCSTILTEFKDCELTGDITGAVSIINCHVNGLTGIGSTLKETLFTDCYLEDATSTLDPTSTKIISFINCVSGVAGQATPVLDFNGATSEFIFRGYNGGIEIRGITQGQVASMDFHSGQVVFDSSNTSGTVTVRGLAKVTDNSVGLTVTDETFSGSLTAAQDEQLMKTLTVAKFLGLK